MDHALDHKIAEIRQLIETRLRIRGGNLRVQLRRAGRMLPRGIRRDLRYLADAEALAENPKLARMIDGARVNQAHRNAVAYLAGVDPRERMWNQLRNITASIALAFIVIFVVVLYVLVQRGFV
ncbi:hypothetical protein [Yoonia sp.]|uniref:hypothetical protein n=1 Tax=Yoonia sp. TaxID=2212373 RepID=UPI0025CF6028|nr:hypothetical protein [Yoonia sp.]